MGKKAPKNAQKAFAVVSCVGSAIKIVDQRTVKHNALFLQAGKARSVFRKVAGNKTYFTIDAGLTEIWTRLSKKHDTLLTEDSLGVYIEMLCMLIPPKDFKEFMGVSAYRSKAEVDPKTYATMAKSILDLDHELNLFLDTNPYSIPLPKKKIEKIKKERDVAKPKVLKKIRNRVKWNRKRIAV
jgi:hypothetical protein